MTLNQLLCEFVLASKISLELPRFLHFDDLRDQRPSSCDILCRPTHLEVIHTHNKEEVKLFVPEHAGPILHFDVTDLLQRSLAVLLPKGSSVGMSVQCQHKDNDWVLIPGIPATVSVEPPRRPLVTRNPHPSLLSLWAGLSARRPSLTSRRFSGSNP